MPRTPPIVSWDKVPVIFDIPLAAEILGLNQEYTRQMLADGKLPGFKVGNCWRINKSELLGWIANGGSQQKTKEDVRSC